MITVTKFTISSTERRQKQPVKDIEILPKNGAFVFFDAAAMESFEDELRQTFEQVLVFGCTVAATINNQFVHQEATASE